MEGHAYKAMLPLEWERKAFEEVKTHINEMEKSDIGRNERFKKENKKILGMLRDNNIQTVRLSWEKGEETLSKLTYDIYDKMIRESPILVRLFLYNIISPPNVEARQWLRDYLPDELLSLYRDILSLDLLKCTKLVKIRGEILDGVPTTYFVVGQILQDLFEDFDHYQLIDEVKKKGAKESVEELRKNRIYQTPEGTVWDYSPIFKRELSKSGIIVEVFTKEDFEKAKKGKETFARELDSIVCTLIQKAQRDPRENIYFGYNLDSGFKYTVRFNEEEETVPIQLAPKYKNLVKKIAGQHNFTQPTRERKEKTQTALIGLMTGARTWSKEKGPATNWLADSVKYEVANTFKTLSTEQDSEERRQRERLEQGEDFDLDRWFQKRILKETFESLGGRIGRPVVDKNGKEKGKYGDKLPDESSPPSLDILLLKEEEKMRKEILNQIIQTKPNMVSILEKEEKGEALTEAERVTKYRIIKEFQRKLEKQKE